MTCAPPESDVTLPAREAVCAPAPPRPREKTRPLAAAVAQIRIAVLLRGRRRHPVLGRRFDRNLNNVCAPDCVATTATVSVVAYSHYPMCEVTADPKPSRAHRRRARAVHWMRSRSGLRLAAV